MDLITEYLLQSPFRWGHGPLPDFFDRPNLAASVAVAAYCWGILLASTGVLAVTVLCALVWRDRRMHPLKTCTFFWIYLAGLMPFA